MPEAIDQYTATRLSAELGLDNRKMRDILTRVNPVQVKGRSKLYLLRARPRNSRCLDLFGLRVNAEARKVGSGHWVDAAAVDPTAGRRQTGQGRDNIVPYLFS